LFVCLDGFVVVAGGAVEEAVDVPAYVRSERWGVGVWI
jgi:hypothetical protein